jgi:hypothetical protein
MNAPMYERLRSLGSGLGELARTLRIGSWQLRLDGLDDALATALERRFGPFLSREEHPAPRATVTLLRAGPAGWLDAPAPGEHYRLEAVYGPARRVIASYHFALCALPGGRAWRVGLTDRAPEPQERAVDNALRVVVASLALAEDGFAMHAAAVLRDGRAWVFAGPSRSGKTTAVGLARPARSLGDDFALVVRRAGGWHVPATPFDNAERVVEAPPAGLHPLAGIYRLYPAGETRVERPAASLAVASLVGCAAFPWALPEAADALLERASRLAGEGRFAHLHFRKDAALWDTLTPFADGSASESTLT